MSVERTTHRTIAIVHALFLTTVGSARTVFSRRNRVVAAAQSRKVGGYSMAQTPRDRLRFGEHNDENRPDQRAKQQLVSALTNLPSAPFSPVPNPVAALFTGPPKTPAVVNRNGSALCVTPARRPAISSEQQADQRRAIERALFMARSPLGGAAYGLASLANVSPEARDRALIAGGLVDAAMIAAAPRGAPGFRAASPRPGVGQVLERPDIRLRDVNAAGQAQGATATIGRRTLGSGSKPDRRVHPPGWQGHGTKYNEARAHLVANQLGGTGRDPRMLVTMTQTGANAPQMSGFERGVAARARAGEYLEYTSIPLYSPGVLPPSAVLVTAHGPHGRPTARLITNPAGRRR